MPPEVPLLAAFFLDVVSRVDIPVILVELAAVMGGLALLVGQQTGLSP
ncbi:MAG: hypothetical protein KGZ41_08130 [Dethiobacter sp.]|nr:hypothetical protein [Dethiobacter sp.]MBS3983750.1 hypothetical protein [Dethiobacter sp.]